MDKMKQWVALTVVGVLAIVVGGWMLLISPKKSEASDLKTQAEQVQTSNRGLEVQLATLKAQQKQMPQFQAKLAQLSAKIPNNPALPGLIRALSAAADDAGVELVTVAPSVPTAYQPAAAPAQVVAPTAKSGSTTSAPAQPRAAAPATLLQVINLNLNVAGGYFETEQFFDKLEKLTRAFKVTSFSMAPGANPVKPVAGTGGTTAPTSATNLDGSSLLTTIAASVYMSTPAAATAPAVVAPAK